jgi:hypothetical protein
MKHWLALILVLTGCAGERVKDLGEGRHSLTVCSEDGITNSQVAANRAADNYCAKSALEAVVESFDEQECPNSRASATRVVFICR